MAEPTEIPAWGHELEYYLNIGTEDGANWIKVTELLSWDDSGDSQTYTPSWIDRKNQPTFTLGRTSSISWEKDTLIGGTLDEWVMTNRNKSDIPCQIAAVYTWMGAVESQAADLGSYLFSPNRPKNSNVAQPVVIGGTCNMTSDGLSEGTWNSATKTFTESAAGEEGTG